MWGAGSTFKKTNCCCTEYFTEVDACLVCMPSFNRKILNDWILNNIFDSEDRGPVCLSAAEREADHVNNNFSSNICTTLFNSAG